MRTLLAFLLITLAVNASAQVKGSSTGSTISGTIRNQQDESLPGANIYLRGTYDGTTSNTEGFYKLITKRTGKFMLVIEYLGYESVETEINLVGDEIKQDIKLKETFNKLDVVTISAGTFEAGDKKQSNTLSSLDMITTAGAMGDVFGALETLPGTTSNGESGMLFVKGGDSGESQTFIDGALVHTPYNSAAPNTSTRGRFNPFMFKGTIFSTGGYSAEYGQALSSVLLLSTNDMPEQDQFDLSLMTIGPEIAGTKLWKNGAITATLSYMNLKPYMELVPQNYDWKKAPENTSAAFSIRQKTGKTGMLKVYGSFDNSNFSLAQKDLDLDKMIDYNLDNKNYFVNTSWKTTLGKHTTLTTSSSFTNDNDDVTFDSNTFEKQNRGIHFKEAISQEINAKTTLRAGAEWMMNTYDQSWLSTEDTIRIDYENHTVAAFAEAELYTSKRFVTRIGIRAEHSSYLDKLNIAPRITAAWKLNESSQFSVAYGWFLQNPANEFLIYTDQLDYERADHYTLSYQSSKNERTLRAEIYYKDYSNLVRQLPGTFYLPENYNNTGSGYAKGIDLFWRDKKSIKNGDYWVSYSWLDTERDYRDYPEMATPSYASAHNLAVVYKHWFGGIRSYAGLNYRYSSPRPYNNPNSNNFNDERTIPYQTLDVSWSFLYKPNIIFYGAVTNVPGFKQEFGKRYSDNPDVDGNYQSANLIPGSGRFYILACFITFTKKGTDNQLDKIQ